MLLVLFFNIFDKTTRGVGLLDSPIDTVPFLLLIMGSFIFKGSVKYYSFIYLFIGVCTILYGDTSASNFSGSIFLILSCLLYRNNKYYIFIVFITIILLTIRSYTLKDSSSNTLMMITAYLYLYSIFYIIHSKKKKTPPEDISKKDYDRLLLLSKGYTSKEICDILDISINPYSLNREFKKLMKSYGCDNMFQFGIKLNKMEIIDFDES